VPGVLHRRERGSRLNAWKMSREFLLPVQIFAIDLHQGEVCLHA
jgi:hypothetical protein